MSVAEKMNPAQVTNPPPAPPKREEKPACFGEYRADNTAAERECYTCPAGAVNCMKQRDAAALPLPPIAAVSAADILADMAHTFRERNKVYGDNYKMVGKLMAVLFPAGVSPELLHSHQFHLFELKLVKLSRFAISGLQHVDSIHDDAVYSAMIEMILKNEAAS